MSEHERRAYLAGLVSDSQVSPAVRAMAAEALARTKGLGDTQTGTQGGFDPFYSPGCSASSIHGSPTSMIPLTALIVAVVVRRVRRAA